MAEFRRILLTGGAGFVGSHLAPLLAADYPGAKRALLTLRGAAGDADSAWTRVEGDLLDVATLDRIVEDYRPDLVVHLAGQASIGKALHAGEATWRANLVGSFNLAGALTRYAPETTVLFASSASVYGLSLRDGPACEDTLKLPLDSYGRSKAAAEGMFQDVLDSRSRLVVVRPVNHTGPRQSERQFVLSSFAAQIAAIESGRIPPMLKVGDLTKARDFLDVRDVVAAYAALMQLGRRGVAYNVCSGTAVRMSALLDQLLALSGARVTLEQDPDRMRPNDLAFLSGDSGRIHSETGWAPRIPLKQTLSDLLDYWRRAPVDTP
jgi:GDP-4-dehydro-6-deoxy-D-mannose reductase